MPILKTPSANINYQVGGQGQPVLFIQGIGVTGEGWRPQLDDLSRDHETVSFDNRGIGLSQINSGGVTVAEMAEDAFALMDHLGWESAHIVGHSLGGIIAQEMGLNRPKRVKSLTLMCTFACGADGARFTFWSLWMFFRTRVGSLAKRRRAFLEMLFTSSFLRGVELNSFAAQVGKIVGRDLAVTPPVLMKQFNALKSHDRFKDLGRLKEIPTLVISAAQDKIATCASGMALAAAVPGSKYVEYADAAHGLPIQMPEKIKYELRKWFSSQAK